MTIDFTKPGPVAEVAALTVSVDEQTITEYIALSDRLPIIVLFSSGDVASQNLKATLEKLTDGFAGRLLTLIVDAQSSPSLVQAFEVAALPAVYGLLKGQPAPLFSGDQDAQQVKMVLERVMQVGTENQLDGTVTVSITPAEPELSETHKAAFEKIDQGDYQGAIELYQLALRENPNDSLAEAGLAQVNLLVRLDGKELELVLSAALDTPEALMAKADALVATGQAKAGFDILLELFAKTPKDERDQFRVRLLELFQIVGLDSPEVSEARKKLSLLLF